MCVVVGATYEFVVIKIVLPVIIGDISEYMPLSRKYMNSPI